MEKRTDEAYQRYGRQILLSEIGDDGQKALSGAKVLIVGAGGLGSPIALYLAAAGVGTIGLADCDVVSISNLNRQILYNEGDVGKAKVAVAERRLKELNSMITVESWSRCINVENAEDIISGYDIVVDACDNAVTRYAVCDIAAKLGKPFVYGAISGFEGQISVFNYGNAPKTYRDLWPESKDIFEIEHFKGVIGVTAGVVGILQANEAIKIICGFGDIIAGKLFVINLKTLYTAIVDL